MADYQRQIGYSPGRRWTIFSFDSLAKNRSQIHASSICLSAVVPQKIVLVNSLSQHISFEAIGACTPTLFYITAVSTDTYPDLYNLEGL